MAAVQLGFSLRTSPNCKAVHLVGNWDNYKGQLPLSRDSSKTGSWKGTFRFQGATLKQGQRYWYYYVMDGHHVSHDPAREHTTEPTTGRKLNILDVPPASSKSSSTTKPILSINTSTTAARRKSTVPIATGRGLSPSRIISPQPQKPLSTVDNLTRSLAAARLASRIADSSSGSDFNSDSDSDVPSLMSSRTSACSSGPNSPASRSSSASSDCSCKRFGITRKGDRVRLDCGGSRCGGSSASDASSDGCSDSERDAAYRHRSTRRQGVVVRNSRR